MNEKRDGEVLPELVVADILSSENLLTLKFEQTPRYFDSAFPDLPCHLMLVFHTPTCLIILTLRVKYLTLY